MSGTFGRDPKSESRTIVRLLFTTSRRFFSTTFTFLLLLLYHHAVRTVEPRYWHVSYGMVEKISHAQRGGEQLGRCFATVKYENLIGPFGKKNAAQLDVAQFENYRRTHRQQSLVVRSDTVVIETTILPATTGREPQFWLTNGNEQQNNPFIQLFFFFFLFFFYYFTIVEIQFRFAGKFSTV
ncbi:conserved hypothetical protein [Trichinella spiralis]|uniref:hypothetical protein n=1 Tax=Trichinella spiralis TaxID=6334 RepID=UPI0001EFD709|nr:conserved hypothetical protein [Trichinella spiralis]